MTNHRKLSLVLGAQWGDEGKGKLVDILGEKFDIIARATGGANAGHTVKVLIDGEEKKFVFHLLPSGVLYSHIICVIGNGVVLHVPTFFSEIQKLKDQGIDPSARIKISERATLLFDFHKMTDGAEEDSKGDKKVGTTKRGIGPAYSDKINRKALRVCDLKDWPNFEKKYKEMLAWHERVFNYKHEEADAELAELKNLKDSLLQMSADTALYLNEALAEGKSVLLEGANALLLDVDHGTYPYVTSSSPSIGGVFTGTGISPKYLNENIGIVKAYMTRVGLGPFPSELNNAIGDSIREAGGEYGSTTGRPRRCGWFDAPLTRYGIMINGFDALNLTKLDVLDDLNEIKIAEKYFLNGEEIKSLPALLEDLEKVEVKYISLPGWKESISNAKTWNDLPENAKNYVLKLEELLNCPIKYIGVGGRRDQMIFR